MKAIVRHRYGLPEVIELKEIGMPVVADDRVLVRVHAASLNPYDWHHLTGTPYFLRMGAGFTRPKDIRLGMDFAGRVEAVGRDVTRLRPGDEVYGMRSGALAEYVDADPDRIALKPSGLSFEAAASIPMAATTVLQALRDVGEIQSGQRVLIIGGSGGCGTYAIQIAKWYGTEVTAVCSTRNVAQAKELGADHVIDYKREDFVRNGQTYDLILDNVGTRTARERRRLLRPHGRLVAVSGPKKNRLIGPMPALLWLMLASRKRGRRMTFMVAKNSVPDLDLLRELLETGKVKPVVEKTYPLAQTPAAFAYLGQGHAQAKLVITI